MGRRPLAAALVAVARRVGRDCVCGGVAAPVVAARRADRHRSTGRRATRVECGSLSVPLDFAHPDGRAHHARARPPARAAGKRDRRAVHESRRPGRVGRRASCATSADVFPAEIRDSFDLVSWDPRGVGASTPVHCVDDLDPFFAVDRDPARRPREVAQNVDASRSVRRRVPAQQRRDPRRTSRRPRRVRDLDAIRAAIGVAQINYVGFSYGTFIGAIVRRHVPDARAGDGARRRGRPGALVRRHDDRPGQELRRRSRRVLRALPRR